LRCFFASSSPFWSSLSVDPSVIRSRRRQDSDTVEAGNVDSGKEAEEEKEEEDETEGKE